MLTEWRRAVCEALLRNHEQSYHTEQAAPPDDRLLRELTPSHVRFTANVANRLARDFYLHHGAQTVEPAFERSEPSGQTVLMTCRHCIRHALGICLRTDHSVPGPLSLRLPDGRTFPLRFDCSRCEMQVLVERSSV